jgi:hypothetical protein
MKGYDMKLLPIGFALYLLATIAAVAAPNKPTFYVNGKPVPSSEAIMASLGGKSVLKCTEVEAKPSKTGTSIGLRAKKAL